MLRKLNRQLLTIVAKLLLLVSALSASSAYGEVTVVDDMGLRVTLKQPAQRIISLSPHSTEMLYSAGAGDKVVGVVSFSNYPEAATRLPQVGGYRQIDLEAVLALQPDLVVGWHSGNPKVAIERIRSLGIPVYLTEPRAIEQIATNLERLGSLTGSAFVAKAKAGDFRARLQFLQQTYQHRTPVSVFYQVWNEPLMTINGEHMINSLIELCGGKNVFSELPAIAPTISRESVLAANPEVIVASGMNEERPDWLDHWRKWSGLEAVRRNNLFFVPPDLLQRQTVRVMDGAEQLCSHLQTARR
ncbi:MAG: cobalamin-binding protein [Motiliproteus sp.]|nr:cobalamin-binding protein [Motiliproteus sp.]MCW9054269.1 cobalamin-binding protein [Motiliproteus sp.]